MKEKVYTRDVCLIMVAAFFYMFCSMSAVPLIAGYAGTIGASGVVMGIVSALTSGIAIVCRPITGNLSDKTKKIHLILIGCLMMLTACMGYVLVPDLWFLVVMRCVHGVGYAFCSVGMSTWLTMLLPKNKMGSGLGVYGTINALAMAIAPTVGIRAMELWGYQASFLIAGGSVLLALVLALMVKDRGVPVHKETTDQKSPSQKLVYLPVLPIALALGLISIPYTANKSFLVSYVESRNLNLQPDLFFTLYAIALVAFRITLRKQYDKVSYSTFLLLCSFAMIAAMGCLYLMQGTLLMLLGAIFMAGSYGIMFSVSQASTATSAPPDQRGIAMGTYYLGLDFGSTLGPIIGGYLYGNIALQHFYPLLTVFAILCIGMYFICRKLYPKPAQ